MFSYKMRGLKHEKIKCKRKTTKDFMKTERESKKSDLL